MLDACIYYAMRRILRVNVIFDQNLDNLFSRTRNDEIAQKYVV